LAMGCGWNWTLDPPLSREINPTAGFKLPPARLIEVEPAVAVTTPPHFAIRNLPTQKQVAHFVIYMPSSWRYPPASFPLQFDSE
jgi:hypothetical protein